MKKLFLLLIILFVSSISVFSETEVTSEEHSITHQMTTLVLQIAVIVLISKIFGFIFQKYLKQSRVLGELVSGMIIGPFALGGIPVFGSAFWMVKCRSISASCAACMARALSISPRQVCLGPSSAAGWFCCEESQPRRVRATVRRHRPQRTADFLVFCMLRFERLFSFISAFS